MATEKDSEIGKHKWIETMFLIIFADFFQISTLYFDIYTVSKRHSVILSFCHSFILSSTNEVKSRQDNFLETMKVLFYHWNIF